MTKLVASNTVGTLSGKRGIPITAVLKYEQELVYRPSNHFHTSVFRTNIVPVNLATENDVMDRNRTRRLYAAAILLLAYALAGCTQHTPQSTPVPKAHSPNEGHNAMQPLARAIIYFQRPTKEGQELSAAISEACRCQPVFFRPYPGDALIYGIALPSGHTFSAFAEALLRNGARLGIKSVEQDIVMQHQKP